MYGKCPSHLNTVLMLPCENETLHFTLLWCTFKTSPAASSMALNTKFIQYRENTSVVIKYVQNVRLCYKHRHNQRLVQAAPHMQQTLSQLIDVMNSSLIHTLLNNRPNDINAPDLSLVSLVATSGTMKSGVGCHNSSIIVTCTVGTLFCWKIKWRHVYVTNKI